MFSALASLLPESIKRMFEGSSNGGSGGEAGGGNNGGGGRRQRRRSDGSGGGGGGAGSGGGGPVLQEATGFAGIPKGGTQGLDWYSRSMVKDEGGSEAHGFIDADEVEGRAAAEAKAAGGKAAGAGKAGKAGAGKSGR